MSWGRVHARVKRVTVSEAIAKTPALHSVDTTQGDVLLLRSYVASCDRREVMELVFNVKWPR